MNKRQRLAEIAAAICFFLEIEDPDKVIESVKKGQYLTQSYTIKNSDAPGPGLEFKISFRPTGDLTFYDPLTETTLWNKDALEALKKFIMAFSTKRGDFSYGYEGPLLEEKPKTLKEKIVGLLT
jgi:hypothetical protein